MTESTIKVSVDFSETEAWAIAELLKRAGLSDFRILAKDDEEAYQMLYAAEKLRIAMQKKGFHRAKNGSY